MTNPSIDTSELWLIETRDLISELANRFHALVVMTSVSQDGGPFERERGLWAFGDNDTCLGMTLRARRILEMDPCVEAEQEEEESL